MNVGDAICAPTAQLEWLWRGAHGQMQPVGNGSWEPEAAAAMCCQKSSVVVVLAQCPKDSRGQLTESACCQR